MAAPIPVQAINPGSAISTAALSGSDPDQNVERTYTCAGSGCSLAASPTYWIVMSTSDTSGQNRVYQWLQAISTDETKVPSTNGWTIGDDSRRGAALGQTSNGVPNVLKVAATVNP